MLENLICSRTTEGRTSMMHLPPLANCIFYGVGTMRDLFEGEGAFGFVNFKIHLSGGYASDIKYVRSFLHYGKLKKLNGPVTVVVNKKEPERVIFENSFESTLGFVSWNGLGVSFIAHTKIRKLSRNVTLSSSIHIMLYQKSSLAS